MADVPESNSASRVINLLIQFTPGQGVTVTGPLVDKQLCYGMLEMARDIIKDYVAPPQIQIAPSGLLDHIKRHDDKKHHL